AGRQADHAVPGGVAAGATDDHARRHLVLRLKRPQLAMVLVQEPLGRPPNTLIIVRLDRRNLIWVNVTTNPTAEWIARQLTEAFPWHEAPHVIRDRDRIYGTVVTRRLRAMGIRDKPIAPA